MKNRRGFLKLLGIGAGAVAGAAIAAVTGRGDGGGTPTNPPRTPEDVIKGPKPYRGPDSVPGGDFIRKKPDILRDHDRLPDMPPPLTPEQIRWVQDGEQVMTFLPFPVEPPPLVINADDINMEDWNDVLQPGQLIPVNTYTTGGAPYKMSTTDGTS